MLILKSKLQYFSVFLQYFTSKISTSTEESVQLEALHGEMEGGWHILQLPSCTVEPLNNILVGSVGIVLSQRFRDVSFRKR